MRFYTSFRDLGYLVDIFMQDQARGILILCGAIAVSLLSIFFYLRGKQK